MVQHPGLQRRQLGQPGAIADQRQLGVASDLHVHGGHEVDVGAVHLLQGVDGVEQGTREHRAVLVDLLAWGEAQGLGPQGLVRSPIIGPAGNVEFLAHWRPGAEHTIDGPRLVEICLES